MAGLGLGLLLAGCGDRGGDPLERAARRSEAVAAGEWSYGRDTLPGREGPQVVDRCRITLPTEGAAGELIEGRDSLTMDVACGVLFLGLEPDADGAWVERLVAGLGAERVDEGAIPAWVTPLNEPLRYVLIRVDLGEEQRTLTRALASDGVQFVDVREVSIRRP